MRCVEQIIDMIKETMEKKMDILQKMFEMKTQLEKEIEKQRRVLQENQDLRGEINNLRNQTSFLHEKLDELEQDELNFDVLLSNIQIEEVSNPTNVLMVHFK